MIGLNPSITEQVEMTQKIRVILFQDNDLWVAQGLEHDICVQAEKLDDLFGRFEVAVRLESSKDDRLDHIGPAPDHFQKLWNCKSGAFTSENIDPNKYEIGVAA